MPRIHFTGSIPMADRRTVMRSIGQALGDHLPRVPDGEVGRPWGFFMRPAFENNPALEPVAADEHEYHSMGGLRIRPGTDPATVEFGEIGYAKAARESFALFEEEKAAGYIDPAARFQVTLPTPMAPVASMVAAEDCLAVEAAYARRLRAEMAEIFTALPHEWLALQWDVAREFMFVENVVPSPYPDPIADTAQRLADLSSGVPDAVELGFHLCYGNFKHHHFIEPADLGNCIAMANAISRAISRPIGFIHMPVPRNRDDDAYFAPLDKLALHPETELVLGLIHYTDGVDGTRRRMATANRHVTGYAVATECGWGPRDPETIPALLRIHAEIAAG